MNKPGQPTTQQIILQWFAQLDDDARVQYPEVARATGLLPVTVEDALRTLAREGRICVEHIGRAPYYSRQASAPENAWRRFCFDLAAMYGNRSPSCH